MRLTGAVKLTYGCIPGLTKAKLHVRAQRREDFADMLLDLHLALRPRFSIIDGVVAMEGQGPGSGSPRELGSLFAAHDGVALDVALADRTAHERRSVHTIAAAERRGLVDLEAPYALAGDPVEPDAGFVPARRDLQQLLPPSLHRAARNFITARPRLVDAAACTQCAECAQICGARAIELARLPEFDDHACVRCYACTEVCPTAAIDNVTPLLARLLARRR
jgi:ferredoxin